MKMMNKMLFTSLIAVTLTACGGKKKTEPKPSPSGELTPTVTATPTPTEPEVSIDIALQEIGEIDNHTELQKEFFALEQYDYSNFPAEVNARKDYGNNLPISFTWNVDSSVNEAFTYTISISKDEELLNPLVFTTTVGEFDFINYELSTKYYANIEVEYKDKTYSSNVISFTTPSDGFRTIDVDGVTNFRDLGGHGHIKQGMIYRSATFENNTCYDPAKSITKKGIEQIKQLGIKTEIDLRKTDEVTKDGSAAGIENYLLCPLYYGGQNILTYKGSSGGVSYNNPEVIKGIFDELAKEENYPLDFHCVRGTDRTGCLAFLIEALLGESEETLYRDYIYSNYYNIGSSVKFENIEYTKNPSATTKYVNVLRQAEGENLQEKTYNYLSSDKVGVSTETLDAIIDLLKV